MPHYSFTTGRVFTPRESVALRLQELCVGSVDYELKPIFVDLQDDRSFVCTIPREVGQHLMRGMDVFNQNDMMEQLRSHLYNEYLSEQDRCADSDLVDTVQNGEVRLVEAFGLLTPRGDQTSRATGADNGGDSTDATMSDQDPVEDEMDGYLTYELIYIVMMCILSRCHRALGESLVGLVGRDGELKGLGSMTLPHAHLLQSCRKHPMPNECRFLDIVPSCNLVNA